MTDQPWLRRRELLLGLGAAAVTGALAACSSSGDSGAVAAPSRTPSTPPAPVRSASAKPAAARRAEFVLHGPRTKNAVALMFHGDGDRAITDRVIKILRKEKVVVSVFAIGRWLVEQPAVAPMLLDAGHELGNHSYTHPDFRRLTAAQVRAEVSRCRDVLVRQTGSPGVGFLAPEVDVPNHLVLQEVAAAGYPRMIGYDVDPRDWADPGAPAVRRTAVSGSRPGSIVQLHLGHPQTVQALPGLIDGLRAKGLAVTSVSRLLAP